MRTFLFYDLETTDRNGWFGQVMQFAAIRTNENLQELERINIHVTLNNDCIPAPGAIAVNGIDPGKPGDMNEYEAVKKIHVLINTPNTISVGYNTLGFDDEFLRFSFYRNLLPPYTHQYANGCGRVDLFAMLPFYYLFRKDCLRWPETEKGISLKLELLSKENNLSVGTAHDAMVDTQATLALAKILFQDKKMWNYLAGFFQKKMDTQHTDADMGYFVSTKAGAANNFLIPAIRLGKHQTYTNQEMWLQLNKPLTLDANVATLFTIKKKLGEPPFFLKPEARFTELLSEEMRAIMENNIKYCTENPERFSEIKNYHVQFCYPEIENCDPDAALYQVGFASSEDERLCKQFHSAALSKKEMICNQFSCGARKQIGLRLLARHFPEYLSDESLEQYHAYLQSLLHTETAPVDFRGQKKLSVEAALLELDTIQTDKTQLMERYRDWLMQREVCCKQYAPR